MKIYSLNVEYLVDLDGGGITCYYSKGHQSDDEFIAEARKEHEVIIHHEDIRRKYMRRELFGAGPDGPTHCAAFYETPGRGKFPVTYSEAWVDWTSDTSLKRS